MTKEMNEVADTIESFNRDEIDLYEDELFELEEKRKQLLSDYYRRYHFNNVIPLI